MSAIVRTSAAATIPADLSGWQLQNIASTVDATRILIGMSRDRTTLYSAYNSGSTYRVDQSVNDGSTWTTVATFAYPVLGIIELDNGEAIVCCQNGSSSPGYMYRSTGWAASHTAATWTLTLTSSNGWFRPQWSLHRWSTSGPIVITNEYGPQNGTPGVPTATRVYLSQDYGMTWSTILELTARYPTKVTMHGHAAAYDPEWDRLWVTFGDSFPEGNSIIEILYSDDRGATWTSIPVPAEWAGQQSFQVTSIAITPKAIVLGPDSIPFGVHVIPRQGYRKMGTITTSAHWAGGTGTFAIAYGLSQAYVTGAPMLFGMQGMSSVGSSPDVNCPGLVLMSPDDGLTWLELWRDVSASQVSVQGVYGPTISGKIFWHRTLGTNEANRTRYSADLVAR